MRQIIYLFEGINYFGLFSFFVGLFFALFGLYVYIKNSDHRIKYLLLLLVLSFCIWSFGHAFLLMSESKLPINTVLTPESNSLIYSFNAISSFGYCTIWSFIAHLFILLAYKELKKYHKVIIVFNYIISFIDLISVIFGDNIPQKYTKTLFGWSDTPNSKSFFFWFYSFFLIVWIIECLYFAIRFRFVSKKTKDKNQEKQANIILKTGVVSLFFIIMFNHILPFIGISFPAIGSAVIGIFLFGLGYATTKYKFLVPTLEYASKEIFKIGGEMMVVTDIDLRIMEVNDAFIKKLGYSKEQIKNLTLSNIFNKEKAVFFDNIEQKEVELLFTKKDNTNIYVNIKTSFIYNNNIKIGILFVLADITALKNQNEILEQKVQERTKEANNARIEAERRLRITKQYTRKSVTDLIESGQDPTVMNPEIKPMSMLFSDIRGFTKITEKLEIMDVYNILNIYYKYINKAIISSNGEIDKLIGDEVMALFNDSDFAVNAAIDMMKILPELNTMLNVDYKTTINIGIGIDSGDVVRGNIGSDVKMDLTVIGNYVNSASRIEGLTKYYGLPLLISGETNEHLRDSHDIRFIDNILVYGKNKPIEIYEVCDYQNDDFISIKNSLQEHYDTAFKFYREGMFDVAILEYKNILFYLHGHNLMDPVLEFYLNRCKRLNKMKEIGRLNNWNGVYSFLEK